MIPYMRFPEVIALGSRDGFEQSTNRNPGQSTALVPRRRLGSSTRSSARAQLVAVLFWHRIGGKPQSFN